MNKVLVLCSSKYNLSRTLLISEAIDEALGLNFG